MRDDPAPCSPGRPRRVCVVVTARPSYARIRSALFALQARADTHLQLVVSASAVLPRFGATDRVIEGDGFVIAARVFNVIEGENEIASAKTTGLGIIELATVFRNLQPDIVVSIADRYETIATAIAAAYSNIPLAHIQGGEITGSIDEKVRHAQTKLADLHCVASQAAAARVIRMGEPAHTVHVTGCPSIDIAADVAREGGTGLDFDPFERYGGVGARPDLSQGFLVLMQHPVTTSSHSGRAQIMESLEALDRSGKAALVFWPNVDAGADAVANGIRHFREEQQPKRMHFFKNMTPADFLRLLLAADGIVGNSSVGIRECAYLGVPAINIGDRQAGRDRGQNVVDVDYDATAIAAAIAAHCGRRCPSDMLYGDGTAGERIADLLATAPLTTAKQLTW